jgi:hypothetical protein
VFVLSELSHFSHLPHPTICVTMQHRTAVVSSLNAKE